MSTITKEPVTHNLKIWPEYFSAVRNGLKRGELRWNDREYHAGDTLDLCEWDPNEEAFTGDFISVTVTHVAELGQWMPGYVLLSIAPPAPVSDEDLLHMAASAIDDLLSNKDRSGAGVWADIPAKLRRAAMLQGAEPSKISGIMPDYEGGALTQRELFQAGWEAHHSAMLQSGAPVQFGWSKGHFGYHTLFNAIGKAVNIQGNSLLISVSAFEDAMLAAAPQQEVK
ncbi:UNVERIFIED_ORG: hypothetical protein J2S79_001347 [Pantoea agglomerans]